MKRLRNLCVGLISCLATSASAGSPFVGKKTVVLECPPSVTAGVKSQVKLPWEVLNSKYAADELVIEPKGLTCYYGPGRTNPFLHVRTPKGVSCVAVEGKKLAATCTRP